MAGVFLSYAREDAEKAKSLARVLERAGHHVWWDSKLRGGAEFAAEIEAAICRADAVVVAWSKSSVQSPWVRDEAAAGRDAGRLVPVSLDGSQPPMGFRQYQTIDLARWKGARNDERTAALLDAIASQTRASQPGPERSAGAPAATRQRRVLPHWLTAALRRPAIIGVVLLLAAAASVLLMAHGALAPEPPAKLAVMPFADLSPNRDKGFLGEGVAEEILSKLSRTPELRVLGRTSSWALQERRAQPAQIRADLGVTHLLEGSVRSAGDELRLNVRLINTADGEQEWSEDYRGRTGDVFALQEQVATAVARRLSSSIRDSPSEVRRTSADAYHLYLAARQIARTRTEPQLRRAHGLARRAVAAEPNFAPAHALLAELTWMLSDAPDSYGTVPQEKAKRIAMAHARRAIKLAPRASEGYAALGLLLGSKGIEMLKRAIELDPSRSELRLWLALSFDEAGRHLEAINQLQRAAAIDPLWPAGVSRLAIDLAASGRVGEAAEVIDTFERQGGDPAQVARFRATTAMFRGDLSEIVRWGHRALSLNEHVPYVRGYMLKAYSQAGLAGRAANLSKDPRQPIRDAFYRRGHAAAIAAGTAYGSQVWERPDLDFYTFALAAQRQWPTLVAVFDVRQMALEQICKQLPSSSIHFIMALEKSGRPEAQRLAACLRSTIRDAQLAGPRSWYTLLDAQLLALSGRREASLKMLNAASTSGWNDYSHQLRDFPALDVVGGAGRDAIQRRLNLWALRERHEILEMH